MHGTNLQNALKLKFGGYLAKRDLACI